MSSSSLETKTQRLFLVLSDGNWHTTRELARRVGHTFACAKFKLVNAGYQIEKRPHPVSAYQWQYRLSASSRDV